MSSHTALARIDVGPALFFAPTDTAYDRQLIFEFAAGVARGRDAVHLRIGRDLWTVSHVQGEQRVCSACGCRLTVAYSLRNSELCARCAHARLSSNQIAAARPPRKAGNHPGRTDLLRPTRRRPPTL
jgi:hypothetical protein